MGRLTTHVLDTAQGVPAAGIDVALYRVDSGSELIARARKPMTTVASMPPSSKATNSFLPGAYELVFQAGELFSRPVHRSPEPPCSSTKSCCASASTMPTQHYHVPLLVSPFLLFHLPGLLMAAVRFLLDDQSCIEVAVTDPTRTLLQFTRRPALRTGSKEGCAEGRLRRLHRGHRGAGRSMTRLRYRAVNACIQFLPTLDGKALFTVESLKGADGSTCTRCSKAMVDHHGSQCGFCTPGFVMSMFALYHNNARTRPGEIDDALSGNLCRCTGYRPIIDACVHMYGITKYRGDRLVDGRARGRARARSAREAGL